jgi:hypothetical protein
VAAVRAGASADQFKRFKRIYSEPFYVLNALAEEGETTFLMAGSRPGSSYTVRVCGEDGRVTCNCMDAALNCRRLGCVCKHACFLAARVLRVADADLLLAFARTGRLHPEAVAAAAARAASQARGADEDGRATAAVGSRELDDLCDALVSGARVTSRPSAAALDFSIVRREPAEGDECPVCYCDLLSASELVGCPQCGNGIHRACAVRWLAHAPRKTCVYCRSPCWAAFR